jgi:hypothetical protein
VLGGRSIDVSCWSFVICHLSFVVGGVTISPQSAVLPPVGADGTGVEKSPLRRPDAAQHWIFLVLSLAAIGASFFLGVSNQSKVTLPGFSSPVPSLCMFRNVTGLECPGCGLSRAFVCIAHGDLVRAWRYNPASWLVFLFVAAQIPYRTVQLWRIHRGRGELRWPPLTNTIVLVLAIALFAQWLVKLAWWIAY